MGYGHVSPVDCILIISNLGGDFTTSGENINDIDIAANETDLVYGDYNWLLFKFNVDMYMLLSDFSLLNCMKTQFKYNIF